MIRITRAGFKVEMGEAIRFANDSEYGLGGFFPYRDRKS
jgi:hypothetical protein